MCFLFIFFFFFTFLQFQFSTFHKTFATAVAVRRPNIWVFIRVLKDQQALSENTFETVRRGELPRDSERSGAIWKSVPRSSSASTTQVTTEMTVGFFFSNLPSSELGTECEFWWVHHQYFIGHWAINYHRWCNSTKQHGLSLYFSAIKHNHRQWQVLELFHIQCLFLRSLLQELEV